MAYAFTERKRKYVSKRKLHFQKKKEFRSPLYVLCTTTVLKGAQA
jgi:hypothetical protein